MHAIYAIALSVTSITACGGPSTPPTAEAETPTPAPVNVEHEDSEETPPVRATTSAEPVSWTLFEPMRIDRNGVVTVGERVLGTLSGGTLVGPDGRPLATVDADGYVSIEGRRTHMRISGVEVHELGTGGRDELVLRIEGDELVVGEDDERTPIEHLQPARSVDVLFVSAVGLNAMAAAFHH